MTTSELKEKIDKSKDPLEKQILSDELAEKKFNPSRRDYRHRTEDCNRLLFRAYLPEGTHIQIRCPKCGKMKVIDVPRKPREMETLGQHTV